MSLPTPWKWALAAILVAVALRHSPYAKFAWPIGYVAIGAVVAAAGASWLFDQWRSRRLARFAVGLGHRFGARWNPRRRYVQSHPFGQLKSGENAYSWLHFSRSIEGAVCGVGDGELELFEYSFRPLISVQEGLLGERRRRGVRRAKTCAVVSTGVWMAAVRVEPEGAVERIAQRLGFEDIDFEDAEFSSRYAVRSPNRRAAHELISPAWMRLLLDRPGWSIETSGRHLLVWRAGRATAERYRELFDLAVGLCVTLPRTVVYEERSRRGLDPDLRIGAAGERAAEVLGRLDSGAPALAAPAVPCDFEKWRASRVEGVR